MAASWKESEIIPNLFVGDLQDAQRFDGMIINVLPDLIEGEPAHAIHMPFLARGLETLEGTAVLIDDGLARGERVLVHCEEGCERAPLTVAWFLHRRRGMSLDEAYSLMKRQRPMIEDRRRWLGVFNR